MLKHMAGDLQVAHGEIAHQAARGVLGDLKAARAEFALLGRGVKQHLDQDVAAHGAVLRGNGCAWKRHEVDQAAKKHAPGTSALGGCLFCLFRFRHLFQFSHAAPAWLCD